MPLGQNDIVLVDTNVILEAHRTGCWAQISYYFALHTVEKVVEETQTGYQNRAQQEWIDEARLCAAFGHIAHVTREQRAAFDIAHKHPSLDAGEKDLLIYAETMQSPAWLLNSPDMAAVRFAYACGWIDRLISLEAMTVHLKSRLKVTLRRNYTRRWLSEKKSGLLLGC